MARLETVIWAFKVSRELGRLPGPSVKNGVLIFDVLRELGCLQARLENTVWILKVPRELGRLPGPSGKRRFDCQSVV